MPYILMQIIDFSIDEGVDKNIIINQLYVINSQHTPSS